MDILERLPWMPCIKDHPQWRRNNQEMSQKLATYPYFMSQALFGITGFDRCLGALVNAFFGQSLAFFQTTYF